MYLSLSFRCVFIFIYIINIYVSYFVYEQDSYFYILFHFCYTTAFGRTTCSSIEPAAEWRGRGVLCVLYINIRLSSNYDAIVQPFVVIGKRTITQPVLIIIVLLWYICTLLIYVQTRRLLVRYQFVCATLSIVIALSPLVPVYVVRNVLVYIVPLLKLVPFYVKYINYGWPLYTVYFNIQFTILSLSIPRTHNLHNTFWLAVITS